MAGLGPAPPPSLGLRLVWLGVEACTAAGRSSVEGGGDGSIAAAIFGAAVDSARRRGFYISGTQRRRRRRRGVATECIAVDGDAGGDGVRRRRRPYLQGGMSDGPRPTVVTTDALTAQSSPGPPSSVQKTSVSLKKKRSLKMRCLRI